MTNLIIVTMGEKYTTIENLIGELQDALSFMETLDDINEEDTQRKERKHHALNEANQMLEHMAAEYRTAYEDDTFDDTYRICSSSGDIMTEGFCIGGGDEYYKDEEELLKTYTQQEWDEMFEEGDLYWTQW